MKLDREQRELIRHAWSERQKRIWRADERIERQSYRKIDPTTKVGRRLMRDQQRRMFPLNLTRPQAITLFGISTNSPTDTILTIEGPADNYGNIIITAASQKAPALNCRYKLLVGGGSEKLVAVADMGELDPEPDDEST